MKILLLGATGNIGQQTINVIKELNYQLVGISFYHNVKQATKIKAKYKYSPLDQSISNVSSYEELIQKAKPDIVVNAIVGFAGLEATIATIKNRRTLCLANKESMVVAGQFVTKLAKQNHVKIFPIDSEHAALFQILTQNSRNFKKLFITASGGPFYNASKKQLGNVTLAKAIKHPTWKMGAKISIDSATMINKCFEIVEAYWYFHTKNIETLYHPQSLVHAMVQYSSKQIMYVSKPNMQIPIKEALLGFSQVSPNVQDFNKSYLLTKIDEKKWLPIQWAYQILKSPRSSLPIVINAANEVAIQSFMNKQIKFNEITTTIERTIKHFKPQIVTNIKQVYTIDQAVRKYLKN